MIITLCKTNPVVQLVPSHRNNEKDWPSSYMCNFLEAGTVSYEDVNQGVALLKKESMDGWIQTFVDKPVIIDHQDVDPITFKSAAVGYIKRVWFNPADAWYWCEFCITDDTAHELIKNGYSVSCSFDVKEHQPGGEWHAQKYNEEITRGFGLHLALVSNPRYEDCRIEKVANSKTVRFNSKRIENAIDRTDPKAKEMFSKEKGEHPEFSDDDIWKIVGDHMREKENAQFKRSVHQVPAGKWEIAGSNIPEEYAGLYETEAEAQTALDKITKENSIPSYLGTLKSGEAYFVEREQVVIAGPFYDYDAADRVKKSKEKSEPHNDSTYRIVVDKARNHAKGKNMQTMQNSDLEKMSPVLLDKYMQTLSDVGLQTIVDGEFCEEVKKVAVLHQGDRSKKSEQELMLTGKPKEASKMNWKFWSKKGDKSVVHNEKLDADKVFVDVDGVKVSLSTLINTKAVKVEEFEELTAADVIKVNGKDVPISDLVENFRNAKKNEGEEETPEEKKAREEKEAKAKKDAKVEPDGDEDKPGKGDGDEDNKEKKDKKNAKDEGHEHFVELHNAKNQTIMDNSAPHGDSSTREDKAERGKKLFGSKKKLNK